MGQQWTAAEAGSLGAADLGTAQALLEEVTINPTIEPPELTQDWGNRHKQNLMINLDSILKSLETLLCQQRSV